MRLRMWVPVLSCLLFLCAGSCYSESVEESSIAKGVRDKTAKEVEDKYDFEVLIKDVTAKKPITTPKPGRPLPLVIGFRKIIDIPQARKYIVKLVGMYLKNINKESGLESVLTEFPATFKSIDVAGVLFNEKIHKIPPGILWSFALADGVIQYYVFDTVLGKRTVVEESYDEAVEIVDRQMGVRNPKKEVLWEPQPGNSYYGDYQTIEQQIKATAEKTKGSESANWQLCKTESAFLVKAVLSNTSDEVRENTDILSFTPIPFIPASLCRKVHNCLVGTNRYVPLLDIDAALSYIHEGVTLSKNSLFVTNLEWDEKSAIYNSILIVELSKNEDRSKKP